MSTECLNDCPNQSTRVELANAIVEGISRTYRPHRQHEILLHLIMHIDNATIGVDDETGDREPDVGSLRIIRTFLSDLKKEGERLVIA